MPVKILVIPFHGQGHLFPCMELCHLLSSRNHEIILIISSRLFPSIPSTIHQNSLIQIEQLPETPTPETTHTTQHRHHIPPPHEDHLMSQAFEDFLEGIEKQFAPACAIVDVMMSPILGICRRFDIPTISFFTSGACSAALEYALSKHNPEDTEYGESFILPDLPNDIYFTKDEIERLRDPPPPPIPHDRFVGIGGGFPPPPPPPIPHDRFVGIGGGFPPPPPPPHGASRRRGGPPPWVEETEESKALLINTCDDLERPFIEFISKVTRKPVWGVGPLLPPQFWRSMAETTVVHDGEVRSKRDSSSSEEEVLRWLDKRQRRSVIYVSFGSEVGPTERELCELAAGLEQSNRPFIWVVQSGAGPRGFPTSSGGDEGIEGDGKEERGLVIRGWAPQLLILSHPSTGGFISHCGWNSTVESLGCGVPLLAWPIRGDQHYNAKLVASHLQVGSVLVSAIGGDIGRHDVVRGIEKMMEDEEARRRATEIQSMFHLGFPRSSSAALDNFSYFVKNSSRKAE